MPSLPDLSRSPFLAPLGPADQGLARLAIMLTAGLALAMVGGMAATFVVLEAARALGVDLTTVGEVYPEPTLVRSGLYVLEISAGLGGAALTLILVARKLFGRPMASWITAAPRFRWSQLAIGLVLGLVGLVGLAAVSQVSGHEGSLTTDAPILDASAALNVRLFYLAAVSLGFLVAAAAEEVVFRGYVLQQIIALSRNPLGGLMISGALFSLIHLEFSPYALAARAVIGVAFAWTALRLGGLEFAIGAHLANNLLIALFDEPMLPGAAAKAGGPLDLALEMVMALYLAAAAEVLHRRAARPG